MSNLRVGTLLRWQALKGFIINEIKIKDYLLDIGGYDGYVSHLLKKKIDNISCLIIDTDIRGLKKSKVKNLNCLLGSGLEIPIKDNSIDIILCLDLLEHIKDDNLLLKEISRLLKKKGKLICSTPRNGGISFLLLSQRKTMEINKSWGHVRLGYKLENLKNKLKNENLYVKKVDKYFNFITRFIYSIGFLKFPFKLRNFLLRNVIYLEKYIKLGSQEYIIIAVKA